MIVTDPPYNIAYEGKAGRIANDDMAADEFRTFLSAAFGQMRRAMRPGAAYYVWYGSKEGANFETSLAGVGLVPKQQLIWRKSQFTLGRQDYQWQHEPCFYGWKEGAAHYFVDDRTQSTVLDDRPNLRAMSKKELIGMVNDLMEARVSTTVIDEDKPLSNDLHPTMKPLRLLARLIRNSSRRGDRVLDPFGGSGSTLMACEQLGRKCYTMELDERYASAIVRRFEQAGKAAERI